MGAPPAIRIGSPATSDGPVRPRVVVVSHVRPWPASAGNEYRVARLIAWLERTGYEVHLVYRALGDTSPRPEEIADLAIRYPRLCVVDDLDQVSFATDSSACERALTAPARPRRTDYDAKPLHDERQLDPLTAKATRQFAPGALIEVVTTITEAVRPIAVIAEYIFMSRLLPFLPDGPLRVLDLHDVFSAKRDKVQRLGIQEDLSVPESDEARLIRRADVVIAIQPEEARLVKQLVPDRRVITAGIDYPVIEADRKPRGHRVLVVGSDNPLNASGMAGFLHYCWPSVRRAVPRAELAVVGSVGRVLSGGEPGVKVLGWVEDLDAVYGSARVAANPTVAGTGLKVKTLEAIAHLRPVVVWPAGAEGLAPELRAACTVVTDWHAFAAATVRHLRERVSLPLLRDRAAAVRTALSAESAYAELAEVLEQAHHRAIASATRV